MTDTEAPRGIDTGASARSNEPKQPDTSKSITAVELQEDVQYPFTWRTDNLGVAEFMVCPVYRYGKLREFHMHALQQEKHTRYQHIFEYPPMDWSISSWTHRGMESPRIWVFFWCKEHKSNSFRFYVPKDSTHFTVSMLSNFSIDFSNEPVSDLAVERREPSTHTANPPSPAGSLGGSKNNG